MKGVVMLYWIIALSNRYVHGFDKYYNYVQ